MDSFAIRLFPINERQAIKYAHALYVPYAICHIPYICHIPPTASAVFTQLLRGRRKMALSIAEVPSAFIAPPMHFPYLWGASLGLDYHLLDCFL